MANRKIQIVNQIRKKQQRASDRLVLARAVTRWIRSDPKINLLNYWYYRYMTNQFELFILKEEWRC